MIAQGQSAIGEGNQWQAGVLIGDESADAKAGASSAGAARQQKGRLGKMDPSQGGVDLGYAKDRVWTGVEGELFLPEKWFSQG
jgi:SRSO17 transposase